MSRPRIRTLKPECWQDEKVVRVSRDARLLFTVLITLADDEGRFMWSPTHVLGHGYPFDTDAPRKLSRWVEELRSIGLVEIYEAEGLSYGRLPGWSKHQRVSHPSPSKIPEPHTNGSRSSPESLRSHS